MCLSDVSGGGGPPGGAPGFWLRATDDASAGGRPYAHAGDGGACPAAPARIAIAQHNTPRAHTTLSMAPPFFILPRPTESICTTVTTNLWGALRFRRRPSGPEHSVAVNLEEQALHQSA